MVHSTLRGTLLQTHCCSWYGCQTWDLAGRSVEGMDTEWNKAVRRTLHLPYKTHRCLLPLLVNGKSFAVQHRSRVTKFLVSFTGSVNSHVSYIGERAKLYSHGPLGRNFTRCQRNERIDAITADLQARAQTIRELIDIRSGIFVLPGASYDEIESAIDFLCCN